MEDKKEHTVILRIGAEGGVLTVLGRKSVDSSWEFRMECDEGGIKAFLSEDDLEGMSDDCFHETSDWVSSFQAALGLIGKYDWEELHPVDIHPEFRNIVFAEVFKRGGRKPMSFHITQYQYPGGKAFLSRTKIDPPACPSYPCAGGLAK